MDRCACEVGGEREPMNLRNLLQFSNDLLTRHDSFSFNQVFHCHPAPISFILCYERLS